MNSDPIPVELGELQDRDFESPQSAIAHEAARNARFAKIRLAVSTRAIQAVMATDFAIVIGLDNFTWVEFFVDLCRVESRVIGRLDGDFCDVARLMGGLPLLWRPINQTSAPFEAYWDRTAIVSRLIGATIRTLDATDTSIIIRLACNDELLCLPCRYRTTGKYMVYWDWNR